MQHWQLGCIFFGGWGKLAPILSVPPPTSTKIKTDLVMVIVLTTKQVHGISQLIIEIGKKNSCVVSLGIRKFLHHYSCCSDAVLLPVILSSPPH